MLIEHTHIRERGIHNGRIQQVDIFTSLDKSKKKEKSGMSQIYHTTNLANQIKLKLEKKCANKKQVLL